MDPRRLTLRELEHSVGFRGEKRSLGHYELRHSVGPMLNDRARCVRPVFDHVYANDRHFRVELRANSNSSVSSTSVASTIVSRLNMMQPVNVTTPALCCV